jgi:hypothetical protein
VPAAAASGRTPGVVTTGSGNGKGGANGEAEHEPEGPSVGEIPDEIAELAENCRQFVLQALKVELDYEPETLPVLDEYLRIAGGGVHDRPELEPLVARTAAAYFGEVVRRRIDGFWRRGADPASDEWVLSSRRAFLSLSPLGMVMESLARGEEVATSVRPPSAGLELGPDDRELAEARLAVFPPVPEDEYYLLSTRLEVIETVYEAVRGRMKEEDRDSLVFDESDYEDE